MGNEIGLSFTKTLIIDYLIIFAFITPFAIILPLGIFYENFRIAEEDVPEIIFIILFLAVGCIIMLEQFPYQERVTINSMKIECQYKSLIRGRVKISQSIPISDIESILLCRTLWLYTLIFTLTNGEGFRIEHYSKETITELIHYIRDIDGIHSIEMRERYHTEPLNI